MEAHHSPYSVKMQKKGNKLKFSWKVCL